MCLTTFVKLMTPFLLGTALLNAQATRTWISGVGDDVNPCSRTAPCKTFAGAISKTAAGGEIDALDPGGFGAVTITKGITLDGGGGQVASILATGVPGINVAAPVGANVVIRNLSINGFSGSGTNGIVFNSGASLRIENCNINGFSQSGINISPNNASGNPPQVFVINSTVNDNTDSGIRSNVTQRVLVSIVNSRFNNNGNYGVFAGDFARFSVNNSDASGNGTAGFIALANNGDVVMNVANSTASNNSVATNLNGTGIQAGGGTAPSFIRLASVIITSNFPHGMVIGSNGNIVTFGQNANSGDGAPNMTITRQ